MVEPLLFATIFQQTNELWRRLERFEYENILPLLTPDCRWKRDGRWREGRADILAALNERPPARIVRHVICSFSVAREGDDLVSRYTIAGAHSGGAPETSPPYSTSTLRRIGDCEDRFVQTEGQWLFASLDVTALFVGK